MAIYSFSPFGYDGSLIPVVDNHSLTVINQS